MCYDPEAVENAGMDYKSFMERQWVGDLAAERRRNSGCQIAAAGVSFTAWARRF
jgi:hypothetical protein